MDYFLKSIHQILCNLYDKRDEIPFHIFNKISALFYKILKKTLKEMDNVYYEYILLPKLNEVVNNRPVNVNMKEKYITGMLCITYLLNRDRDMDRDMDKDLEAECKET